MPRDGSEAYIEVNRAVSVPPSLLSQLSPPQPDPAMTATATAAASATATATATATVSLPACQLRLRAMPNNAYLALHRLGYFHSATAWGWGGGGEVGSVFRLRMRSDHMRSQRGHSDHDLPKVGYFLLFSFCERIWAPTKNSGPNPWSFFFNLFWGYPGMGPFSWYGPLHQLCPTQRSNLRPSLWVVVARRAGWFSRRSYLRDAAVQHFQVDVSCQVETRSCRRSKYGISTPWRLRLKLSQHPHAYDESITYYM